MPAINFISAYNMSKNLKLNIYLVDVDPISGQMTPDTLKNCIKTFNIKNKSLIYNVSWVVILKIFLSFISLKNIILKL